MDGLYHSLIDKISLPDPIDCHVIAAAIRSLASIIDTYNLKDFPIEQTQKYGVEAQHPLKVTLQYISSLRRQSQ